MKRLVLITILMLANSAFAEFSDLASIAEAYHCDGNVSGVKSTRTNETNPVVIRTVSFRTDICSCEVDVGKKGLVLGSACWSLDDAQTVTKSESRQEDVLPDLPPLGANLGGSGYRVRYLLWP